MQYEHLLYEVDSEGIGVVMLNRPTRANAMNQAMLHELERLCVELEHDARLRCVIVTGAGKAFSSGFDLKDQAAAMPQGVQAWRPLLEADFKGIMSFWNLSKPSVAAVDGPALAGGFELMLGCDLTVASDTSVFGEPELKFGAGIVAMLLPWFVSPKIAREIILTGEDGLTAARALELGLVNRVVPSDAVMREARALALKMARMDPMVMRQSKHALNRTYELMGMQQALRAALDIDLLIEGEGSDLKREFLKVVREQGMGRALAWRDQRQSM